MSNQGDKTPKEGTLTENPLRRGSRTRLIVDRAPKRPVPRDVEYLKSKKDLFKRSVEGHSAISVHK